MVNITKAEVCKRCRICFLFNPQNWCLAGAMGEIYIIDRGKLERGKQKYR